jgi:hypothetical protein
MYRKTVRTKEQTRYLRTAASSWFGLDGTIQRHVPHMILLDREETSKWTRTQRFVNGTSLTLREEWLRSNLRWGSRSNRIQGRNKSNLPEAGCLWPGLEEQRRKEKSQLREPRNSERPRQEKWPKFPPEIRWAVNGTVKKSNSHREGDRERAKIWVRLRMNRTAANRWTEGENGRRTRQLKGLRVKRIEGGHPFYAYVVPALLHVVRWQVAGPGKYLVSDICSLASSACHRREKVCWGPAGPPREEEESAAPPNYGRQPGTAP